MACAIDTMESEDGSPLGRDYHAKTLSLESSNAIKNSKTDILPLGLASADTSSESAAFHGAETSELDGANKPKTSRVPVADGPTRATRVDTYCEIRVAPNSDEIGMGFDEQANDTAVVKRVQVVAPLNHLPSIASKSCDDNQLGSDSPAKSAKRCTGNDNVSSRNLSSRASLATLEDDTLISVTSRAEALGGTERKISEAKMVAHTCIGDRRKTDQTTRASRSAPCEQSNLTVVKAINSAVVSSDDSSDEVDVGIGIDGVAIPLAENPSQIGMIFETSTYVKRTEEAERSGLQNSNGGSARVACRDALLGATKAMQGESSAAVRPLNEACSSTCKICAVGTAVPCEATHEVSQKAIPNTSESCHSDRNSGAFDSQRKEVLLAGSEVDQSLGEASSTMDGDKAETTEVAATSNVVENTTGKEPDGALAGMVSVSKGLSHQEKAVEADTMTSTIQSSGAGSELTIAEPTPAIASAAEPAKDSGVEDKNGNESSTNSASEARAEDGGFAKPTFLFLQVVGPSPSKDKATSAKKVRLTAPDEPPANLVVTVVNPGVYTLYVSASSRWIPEDLGRYPAEEPIAVTCFDVPKGIFTPFRAEKKCSACGRHRRQRRRTHKSPLASGSNPLCVRLIPNKAEGGGLSFLANVSVHAMTPSGISLPCRECKVGRVESAHLTSSGVLAHLQRPDGRPSSDIAQEALDLAKAAQSEEQGSKENAPEGASCTTKAEQYTSLLEQMSSQDVSNVEKKDTDSCKLESIEVTQFKSGKDAAKVPSGITESSLHPEHSKVEECVPARVAAATLPLPSSSLEESPHPNPSIAAENAAPEDQTGDATVSQMRRGDMVSARSVLSTPLNDSDQCSHGQLQSNTATSFPAVGPRKKCASVSDEVQVQQETDPSNPMIPGDHSDVTMQNDVLADVTNEASSSIKLASIPGSELATKGPAPSSPSVSKLGDVLASSNASVACPITMGAIGMATPCAPFGIHEGSRSGTANVACGASLAPRGKSVGWREDNNQTSVEQATTTPSAVGEIAADLRAAKTANQTDTHIAPRPNDSEKRAKTPVGPVMTETSAESAHAESPQSVDLTNSPISVECALEVASAGNAGTTNTVNGSMTSLSNSSRTEVAGEAPTTIADATVDSQANLPVATCCTETRAELLPTNDIGDVQVLEDLTRPSLSGPRPHILIDLTGPEEDHNVDAVAEVVDPVGGPAAPLMEIVAGSLSEVRDRNSGLSIGSSVTRTSMLSASAATANDIRSQDPSTPQISDNGPSVGSKTHSDQVAGEAPPSTRCEGSNPTTDISESRLCTPPSTSAGSGSLPQGEIFPTSVKSMATTGTDSCSGTSAISTCSGLSLIRTADLSTRRTAILADEQPANANNGEATSTGSGEVSWSRREPQNVSSITTSAIGGETEAVDDTTFCNPAFPNVASANAASCIANGEKEDTANASRRASESETSKRGEDTSSLLRAMHQQLKPARGVGDEPSNAIDSAQADMRVPASDSGACTQPKLADSKNSEALGHPSIAHQSASSPLPVTSETTSASASTKAIRQSNPRLEGCASSSIAISCSNCGACPWLGAPPTSHGNICQVCLWKGDDAISMRIGQQHEARDMSGTRTDGQVVAPSSKGSPVENPGFSIPTACGNGEQRHTSGRNEADPSVQENERVHRPVERDCSSFSYATNDQGMEPAGDNNELHQEELQQRSALPSSTLGETPGAATGCREAVGNLSVATSESHKLEAPWATLTSSNSGAKGSGEPPACSRSGCAEGSSTKPTQESLATDAIEQVGHDVSHTESTIAEGSSSSKAAVGETTQDSILSGKLKSSTATASTTISPRPPGSMKRRRSDGVDMHVHKESQGCSKSKRKTARKSCKRAKSANHGRVVWLDAAGRAKSRRNALIERGLLNAMALHTMFRWSEPGGRLRRKQRTDELSLLFCTADDPIIPDNTSWYPPEHGNDLPYDPFFDHGKTTTYESGEPFRSRRSVSEVVTDNIPVDKPGGSGVSPACSANSGSRSRTVRCAQVTSGSAGRCDRDVPDVHERSGHE